MKDFTKQYKEELEKEVMQFLFLCGEKDSEILLLHNSLKESLRLSCIALAFGYVKLFMKIVTFYESKVDEILNGLENLNGNFILVDGWVNAFIKNIENEKARNLMREFWREKRVTLNHGNFRVQNLLDE